MKLLVFLLLPYLSLSEVGLDEVFQDINKCRRFFLNGDPPQFTLPAGDSVKHICQCLQDNNKQKMYFYATLYSTAWRIPIYSAYKFEGYQKVERKDPWYIEPQLDGKTEPCMSPQYSDDINKQAVNCDYEFSGYDRGHLYPVQHTNNDLSMLATSTLTNAAPQDLHFNRGAWSTHEKAVKDDLEGCDEAYVVTGVFPDINIKIPTNNPRVTVSKYYWRATCCVKNGVVTGKGYFGPDNNNKVQPLSITALQTQLDKDYNVTNIKIFPSPATGGCN